MSKEFADVEFVANQLVTKQEELRASGTSIERRMAFC